MEPIKKEKLILPKSIKVIIVVCLFITLASSAFAVYLYFKMSKANPVVSDKVEKVGDIVERVGKLIELPTGEEPTFATVKDPSKLQNQPFFAHAKEGDQVLVYSLAKKVILYDPVANKIIEVAPLNTKK